jgi:glutamate-1-semialdehyde 2,1-aminomutase
MWERFFRHNGPGMPVDGEEAGGRMTHAVMSRGAMTFEKSLLAQARLHQLIPGGAHTYARGSDQFPEEMTPVLVRGRGARVEDLDGNWLIEYGMGLRSVTLGHGYQPVVTAVREAAAEGVNFSRPSVWELRAAEDFLEQVPGAEMVKFAKNGSDATTAAIKLARAVTGRDLVAICGNQPFFSIDDWFIASTQMNAGIPSAFGAMTVKFTYNDLASVRNLFDTYPNQIAAVILEPATATVEPAPGFLEELRSVTQRHGSVLIFDEMITGMRWSRHGAQAVYGVTPDLSTWGKAIGNGFAVSALAGKRELMEAGGLNTDTSRVFLLSTTHGAETTGLAAYLAVSAAYAERDVVAEMETQGNKLRSGLEQVASEAGMSEHVTFLGRPSCLVFMTKDHHGQPSQAYRTLFIQELLRRGVLGQSFVISAAHTDADINQTIEAAAESLEVYARAIEAGTTEGLLVGRPVAPALREFAEPRRLRPGFTTETGGAA